MKIVFNYASLRYEEGVGGLLMTLDQLELGATAPIEEVGGEGSFRRRLLELGMLPGTPVTRTGQAPLGDPLSFRVRGAVLALRRADAMTIHVSDSEAR